MCSYSALCFDLPASKQPFSLFQVPALSEGQVAAAHTLLQSSFADPAAHGLLYYNQSCTTFLEAFPRSWDTQSPSGAACDATAAAGAAQ
jgi:hypothetical protein